MKTIRQLLTEKKMDNVISVAPDTSVHDALAILKKGNFGALPVTQGDKLVGIFSERDYARKVELNGKTCHNTKIADIMTPNPVVVTPAQTLEECMKLMTEKGFRHLPVVSDGKVSGMISIKDAVRTVISDKEALIDTVVSLGAQNQVEKDHSFLRLASELKNALDPLRQELSERGAGNAFNNLSSAIDSILKSNQSKKKLENVKVLLATDDPNEEVIAKMALGGSGVELHLASSLEIGKALLQQHAFGIICVNEKMIELAIFGREKTPDVKTVFMTAENVEVYVGKLKQYPFLTNVVAQSEVDRSFTVKSILSTVSKIANEDFFGMEKYLNWGAEIHEHPVQKSGDRPELIAKMEEFCQNLGLRRTLIGRCANVAEELLMNSIYDAPVDSQGKRMFNHLERTVAVELRPQEQAVFRYGCDGMYMCLSVRDPFGSLDRETILDYIESCALGKESGLHQNKGGGGKGLFIILRSGNLTVFNVQKNRATEVIVLFDLETKSQPGGKKSSFHYFEA